MSEKIAKESNFKLNYANSNEQQLVVVRSYIETFFFSNFILIILGVYFIRSSLQFIYYEEFPYALLDFVKIFSEIALIIAFVFTKILFFEIKYRIFQLLSSEVISHNIKGEIDNHTINNQFINRFDFWLNHHLRKLVAVFSALIAFMYYLIKIIHDVNSSGGISELLKREDIIITCVDLMLYSLPSVVYAYFAGVIAWKLFATSYNLLKIPNNYKVNVRFDHPDGAGGLMPVGMLCLHMVYVTVVPTVISAFILTVPFWAPYVLPIHLLQYVTANQFVLRGLCPIILFVGILGSALGLLPFFRFHYEMLQHKLENAKILSGIAEKIVVLKMAVVEISENNGSGSIDDTLKKLNALQSIYEANNKTSSWPMNKQVLVRIWGTQTFLFGQIVLLFNSIKQLNKIVTFH